MKTIKLLICLIFLSYPLAKTLGSDFDFKKAKELFDKCQCDTTSKKNCEEALKHCKIYINSNERDFNKINEAKALKEEIEKLLECIRNIKIAPPIPSTTAGEEKQEKKINVAWDYNHKGNIQWRLGNYNEAIEWYSKAIDNNPKYIYYRNRADAKISKGDYHAAIDDIKKAIERYEHYSGNEDGNGGNYTTLGDAYCCRFRRYPASVSGASANFCVNRLSPVFRVS